MDLDQLIKGITALFQLLGTKVPPWFWMVLGITFLIYCLLKSISFVLSFLNTVRSEWSQLRNPEQKQRRVRRQTFAEHIEHEIRQLSLKEDWKDERFAELEAEVEAEGRRTIFGIIPLLNLTMSGLRREKTLSKALTSSQERLILLEGDPGSGKSVALRHVAQIMAKHAKEARSINSMLPIYVNLRELDRPQGVDINRNLIRSFVLESLKRTNDRDVDQFLDDEFDEGIKNGTWFFLFDSFDELPEVLSSTEADSLVRSYGDAIDAFLHGMNRCRGIVASRQFRGPAYLGWPHFRILPLSDIRRWQLIRKTGLSSKRGGELMGQIDNASQEIRLMASNPLFLTLLCEHVKSGHPFPMNVHAVFETYIGNRLTRDQVRVQRRFALETAQIRAAAENIAFCISADEGLGLKPTHEKLKDALVRFSMDVPNNFTILLDALEFIKLARSDETLGATSSKSFTFAHRRFQEYFATCVVLREPSRAIPEQLLTNARWRETAVVICQIWPIDELQPIIMKAEQLLGNYCDGISHLISSPLEYVHDKEQKSIEKQQLSRSHLPWIIRLLNWLDLVQVEVPEPLYDNFSWPAGLYHLLSLLQEGFVGHLTDLPTTIRLSASKVILSATERRPLNDRKWALEVAGIVLEPTLIYVLKDTFSGQSQWLKEVAFRQLARINTVPQTIAKGIRRTIIELTTTGRLYREQHATKAYLARLPQPQSTPFLSAMRLLLYLPMIDLGWHLLVLICLTALMLSAFDWPDIVLVSCTVCISYFYSWRFTALRLHDVDLAQKIYFNFMARFFCTMILLSFALLVFINGYLRLLFILTLLQILCLIAVPLWAALLGYGTYWPLWAFLPLWPIVWLVLYPFSRLPSFIAFFFHKENYIKLAKGFIIFLLMIVLGAVIGIMLVIATGNNQKLTLYILYFLITLMVIALMLAVFYAIINTLFQLRDWIDWRRWLRHQREVITWEELWKAIDSHHYYTFSFTASALRSVQRRRILAATEETEELLKNINLQVEVELRRKKHKKPLDPLLAAFYAKKTVKGKYNKFVSKVTARGLDALYMLLEDIQTRRKSNNLEGKP